MNITLNVHMNIITTEVVLLVLSSVPYVVPPFPMIFVRAQFRPANSCVMWMEPVEVFFYTITSLLRKSPA